MVYLGLVPCESSTGDTVNHGGITKASNGRVRRILVEIRMELSVSSTD